VSRTTVFLQMIGMVVLYLVLLVIAFLGYRRITHKSLRGNKATGVALFCLASSVVCIIVISAYQKGG